MLFVAPLWLSILLANLTHQHLGKAEEGANTSCCLHSVNSSWRGYVFMTHISSTANQLAAGTGLCLN
jgi:hypothetical protein